MDGEIESRARSLYETGPLEPGPWNDDLNLWWRASETTKAKYRKIAAEGCGGRDTGGTYLRPPPEHEGKRPHFVRRDDLEPVIMEWMDPLWLYLDCGKGESAFARDLARLGYRYLGPAEWLEPSAGGQIFTEPQREYMRTRLAMKDQTIARQDARIAELEGQLLGHRQAMNSICRADDKNFAAYQQRVEELEAENAYLAQNRLALSRQIHDAHDVLKTIDISGGLIPEYDWTAENLSTATLSARYQAYVAGFIATMRGIAGVITAGSASPTTKPLPANALRSPHQRVGLMTGPDD